MSIHGLIIDVSQSTDGAIFVGPIPPDLDWQLLRLYITASSGLIAGDAIFVAVGLFDSIVPIQFDLTDQFSKFSAAARQMLTASVSTTIAQSGLVDIGDAIDNAGVDYQLPLDSAEKCNYLGVYVRCIAPVGILSVMCSVGSRRRSVNDSQ